MEEANFSSDGFLLSTARLLHTGVRVGGLLFCTEICMQIMVVSSSLFQDVTVMWKSMMKFLSCSAGTYRLRKRPRTSGPPMTEMANSNIVSSGKDTSSAKGDYINYIVERALLTLVNLFSTVLGSRTSPRPFPDNIQLGHWQPATQISLTELSHFGKNNTLRLGCSITAKFVNIIINHESTSYRWKILNKDSFSQRSEVTKLERYRSL